LRHGYFTIAATQGLKGNAGNSQERTISAYDLAALSL
jgi:hypothetical protein